MRKGWELIAFKNLSVKIGDGLHGTPKYDPKGDYFFINGNNLNNGIIEIKEDTKRVNYEEYNKHYKELTSNTVLVSINGTLGKVAFYNNEPIILGKSACYINLKNGIVKSYIKYHIQSPMFFETMAKESTGATIKNFSLKSMREYRIPIPSLLEQKQIVAILDQVFVAIDQAKANIQQNIDNAKELFQSASNNLFLNAQVSSDVLPIEKVCNQIFAGGDAPKGNFSKEKTNKYKIPIIANAVKDNGLYGYTDHARVTFPAVTVAARGSGTGHTEIRLEPFLPIVRLIVLVPDQELINLTFLYYSIKNLEIMRSGSAIPQLTVPMFKEHSIPVPKLAEQIEIVQKLEELVLKRDSLISAYQVKQASLDQFKKSILQRAFSGALSTSSVTTPTSSVEEMAQDYSVAAEPKAEYGGK